MNKLYSVHDHWTDINKKNDIDIESIDGVITGIKVNGEDYGGGTSWFNVYSDTVDPSGEFAPFVVNIPLTLTTYDTIKVIYDNTEYILPKQVFNEMIYYGATPGSLPTDIDFSDCPFLIQVLPDSLTLFTKTAGLHTLNISVPQSGGGESDFSTAKVTIIWSNPDIEEVVWDNCPAILEDLVRSVMYAETSPATIIVPLYQNKCYWDHSTSGLTLSGNIEDVGDGMIITGDCTITVSDAI